MTLKRLRIITLVSVLLLLAAELVLVKGHGHAPAWMEWKGFFAALGLAGGWLLMTLAKTLGHVLHVPVSEGASKKSVKDSHS